MDGVVDLKEWGCLTIWYISADEQVVVASVHLFTWILVFFLVLYTNQSVILCNQTPQGPMYNKFTGLIPLAIFYESTEIALEHTGHLLQEK